MRIGDQILRRRGTKLIFGEFCILKTFINISLMHGVIYLPIFLIRIIIVLLPAKILELIYEYILRTNKNINHKDW